MREISIRRPLPSRDVLSRYDDGLCFVVERTCKQVGIAPLLKFEPFAQFSHRCRKIAYREIGTFEGGEFSLLLFRKADHVFYFEDTARKIRVFHLAHI